MFPRSKSLLIILLLASIICLYFLTRNRSRQDFYCRPESDKVKEITKCVDKPLNPKRERRGNYWVLYNYVTAKKRYRCHESITVTTQGDYSFIDNLIPLVERWRGPVSLALYAPGTDFESTINSIAYLRDCTIDLVKDYVTFHVFFDSDHVPDKVPQFDRVFNDCSSLPPYHNATQQMYKYKEGLLYPINVARNVAREASQTHFVLPLDIELYPSPNFISKFLDLISRNEEVFHRTNPRVFPLAVFEIKSDQEIPNNKTKLKEMLSKGTALPFHKNVCYTCHKIPNFKEWEAANETDTFNVFVIGKRIDDRKFWEPFYVGTDSEPLYDERLSWEGKRNKMTQGYAMCALDYDYMVLDNAFLVHKPGIKKYQKDKRRDNESPKTDAIIRKHILPELKVLYGDKEGCVV